MILAIMATYDKKAKMFGGIFTVPQVGVAVRDFGEECKKPESPLNKFAGDYQLVQIAEFDNVTGETKAIKKIVAEAKDYTKIKK